MKQMVEVAWVSLPKVGEELCGDSVKVVTSNDHFTIVLSDGLGSGVKANILSTLTSQIAASMFEEGADTLAVMETLAATLPECQVRKLAYATLAMLRVFHGREAFLVEYDSPPLIVVRDGELLELEAHERLMAGRAVHETRFTLQDGDYMLLVSDGYEHAGVGGIYRLGWGWENIAIATRRWCQTGCDAHGLAQAMKRTCLKLYDGKPGDDCTVIAMHVRPSISATIWTGPPADRADDPKAVERLMSAEGTKVICGGTTAQIAARELGKELRVDWTPPSKRKNKRKRKPGAPPVALLDGVDLVTEGILTLGETVRLLEASDTIYDLPHDDDAPTRLARILLSADDIHLLVGTALNPAQVADLVRGEPMRQLYVNELLRELARRSKQVTVETI